MTADYTYDRDADCFVITDERGNELCRTRSPHHAGDKSVAHKIMDAVNDGRLIFPTTGDKPSL